MIRGLGVFNIRGKGLCCGGREVTWTSKRPKVMDPILPIPIPSILGYWATSSQNNGPYTAYTPVFFRDVGPFFWTLWRSRQVSVGKRRS